MHNWARALVTRRTKKKAASGGRQGRLGQGRDRQCPFVPKKDIRARLSFARTGLEARPRQTPRHAGRDKFGSFIRSHRHRPRRIALHIILRLSASSVPVALFGLHISVYLDPVIQQSSSRIALYTLPRLDLYSSTSLRLLELFLPLD